MDFHDVLPDDIKQSRHIPTDQDSTFPALNWSAWSQNDYTAGVFGVFVTDMTRIKYHANYYGRRIAICMMRRAHGTSKRCCGRP